MKRVTVKVFHSLVAVHTGILEAHCILGTAYESRSEFSSRIGNRYPFTAGLTERVFQSQADTSRDDSKPQVSAPSLLQLEHGATAFFLY